MKAKQAASQTGDLPSQRLSISGQTQGYQFGNKAQMSHLVAGYSGGFLIPVVSLESPARSSKRHCI